MSTLAIDAAVQRAIGLLEADRKAEALACLHEFEPDAETCPTRSNRIGLAHLHAGDPSAALAWFDRVLQLGRASGETFLYQGTALQQLGREDEALASYEEALRHGCEQPVLHYNRGLILREAGRLDESIASLDRASRLDPSFPDALHAAAMVLSDLGKPEAALEFLNRAVRLRPRDVDAWNDHGNLLQALDRFPEAVASYDLAISYAPERADLLNNRGSALHALGRFEAARDDFDAALAMVPSFPEAWSNRGNLLLKLQRPDVALESFDRALALRPSYGAALCGRAVALKELSRFDEALAGFDRALACQPASAHAKSNKATLLLSLGEFTPGWDLYEWRWICRQTPKQALNLPIPEWTGETLANRRLLVIDEQGIGDAIQFVRYLPALAERGAKVTFLCRRPLHRLFRGLESPIELSEDLRSAEDADLQIALCSIPRALKTRASTIPAPRSYLRAEPSRVREWAGRIGPEGFKIGLCWRGSSNMDADMGRAIPLALFLPLARLERVRLVALQKHDPEAPRDDASHLLPGLESFDALDAGPDAFVDTAALMENLDLIITCDTAVAHLAGALGRPVFVLLKKVPDWRWLLEREDSPWYPTMRLFRQRERGDWVGVIDRVAEAIDRLRAERAASRTTSAQSPAGSAPGACRSDNLQARREATIM